MSEVNKTPKVFEKSLLENPFVGSLVVPIAIVLVGALIIFGVTKMLSSERSYRDLVSELQSKTFGNKWIAAYELSKQINSSQIAPEEIPWLVTNLKQIYNESPDPRTRDFIIVATGVLKSPLGLELISKALDDVDANVKMHAVVALGNMPQGITFEWSKVEALLKSEDSVLKQSSIYVLATHHVATSQTGIRELTKDNNDLVKYSAATALINFEDESALDVLKELVAGKTSQLDESQMANFQIGLAQIIAKNKWAPGLELLNTMAQSKINTVATTAKDALFQLKN